ncbi:hypothetical protein [Pseudooctadecabacter jejudonensis]|uniref:Uncharacterized protein n=1 Tax=Pseudooctadecabacter jejudonensis TaxID=1391910 RepID=A0A1Y5RTR6_9RHOB|nr:hypothetical protein [Pseudooctadecabacter jejudonensis]SLN22530.1 hypothetical protein PSJ8397_00916 [Pseudooctadecabacter jejudonensis]
MAGIGHNSGRGEMAGRSWRTHVWRKARADLMPTLPIEVVRRRVARAKELGLPYKTYAGLRAASGDDLIGFMFSSNALRVLRAGQRVPSDRVSKLMTLKEARTLALAHAPVQPDQLSPPTDSACKAPRPFAGWGETRAVLLDALTAAQAKPSRMVLVCDTALEAEWVAAAKLAGSLPSDVFFAR